MKARRVEGLDPRSPLRANAARILLTRLDELRSLAVAALDPAASDAQHDMRIAAKRLRYVLELTQSCFGEEAVAARRAAKNLQSALGDIHDCDVMLPRAEGINSLSALLRARREVHFARFRELWQAETSRGTWAVLERELNRSR